MALLTRGLTLGLCLLVLTACEGSEERAEKHFQSGLELLEDGDVSRAMLEFRNALRLDGSHREARTIFARTARANGNISAAYSNYLRLAEEFSDDVEARLNLSQLAILAQNWEEAERHFAVLTTFDPQPEGAEIVDLAMAFRDAVLAEEKPAIRDLTRQAEELLEATPNDEILVRVLIEGYLNDNRLDDAIKVTASMLQTEEPDPLFYQMMAELLISKGDSDGLEAHFRTMLEKFPDDEDTKANLLNLLVANGRGEQAENLLRDDIAAADDADKVSAHVALVALIRQLRGDDAALEEIEMALTQYEDASLLVALKAGLIFDRGDREEAISLMETITEPETPDDQTNNYKVTLARMLVETGNEVGARQLVEAALANDQSHVEALKMQAAWQISADEIEAAIEGLRTALDREPDDAEAMTLMARAHERGGEPELAQDLLALAVEASGNAPEESLRFARLQIAQERYSSAESVLISALRRTPRDPEILNTLGRVYIDTADWARADQVVDTLRSIDLDIAQSNADDLQLQIIAQRQGRDQGVEFLEDLVASGSNQISATVALIQARLQDGEGSAALALANDLVAANPEAPQIGLVLGNTQLALGDVTAAEATFRQVLAEDPTSAMAVMQLVRTLAGQERTAEAMAEIDTALASIGDDPDLLWAKASLLENDNDIDGAIEIYERLYAQNTDNAVVANNLASLLVTYRTDEASLERAQVVGRRLRNTDFAPFQDTYGWLLYRQGRFQEAITYLEPAAEAMSTDPIVQFHLGKAYLAMERTADALGQFERVVDLAGEDDPRAQIAEARTEVERLTTVSE